MLLGLFFIILLLLLLPHALEFEYRRLQADGNLKIVIWIWKFPITLRVSYLERLGSRWLAKANIHVPQASKDISTSVSLREIYQLVHTPLPRIIKIGSKIASFLLKEIGKLEIKLLYSTGEAALTGWTAGAAWWLVSSVLSILNNRIVFLHKPHVQIKPVFGPRLFDFYLHCIFRIRLGHIIVRSIKQHLKLGKGG